jgi:hypothetical protein
MHDLDQLFRFGNDRFALLARFCLEGFVHLYERSNLRLHKRFFQKHLVDLEAVPVTAMDFILRLVLNASMSLVISSSFRLTNLPRSLFIVIPVFHRTWGK